MEKREMIEVLIKNYTDFGKYIHSLNEEDFLYAANGNWSAGQQLDHLHKSVKPLNQILMLPSFLITLIFGKSNRQGRTYEELVIKYRGKLEKGGKASGRFVPKKINLEHRNNMIKSLDKEVQSLAKKIESYFEKQLETMVIPHPLLGKLTLKEMIYFTIYHVEHHHQLVKKYLSERNSLQ